jgi:hypothetical protein
VTRARNERTSTARFATIVEKYGDPEPRLILTDPRKDRVLQAAIKANRVMTLFQPAVGTAADSGVVGFEPGTGRQFLIFPKSLRALSGKKIVGVKYDLLPSMKIPKSQRAKPSPKPSRATSKPKRKAPKAKGTGPDRSKVIKFHIPDHHGDEDSEAAELKRKVQRAMEVLEDGKAVAAFNQLKRIVES